MGSLLLSLIPTALGIFLSPLAVVAVIAVLVLARARLNSLAFLTGRLIGITVAVVGGYLLLLAFNVQQRRDPSSWLILLHLLLAVVLLIGAGVHLGFQVANGSAKWRPRRRRRRWPRPHLNCPVGCSRSTGSPRHGLWRWTRTLPVQSH